MNLQWGECVHSALDRVEHTSTVAAFYHKFVVIQGLLVQVQPWLPEEYFATRFVYGLRPEYQLFVLRFNPLTIIAAYRLAEIYEESINTYDSGEQEILGFECPDLDSNSPLITEFGNFLHDNMDQITHTTSVEAFCLQFETLKSFLAAAKPWLPESYFASRFVYGLAEEYQIFVLRFNPVTVVASFRLALLYEESVYLQYCPESECPNAELQVDDKVSENPLVATGVERAREVIVGEDSSSEFILVASTAEIYESQDTPESLDVAANDYRYNILPNLCYQQSFSATAIILSNSNVDYVQLHVLTHNNELNLSTFKDPKVHPPDLPSPSVYFKLFSHIHTLLHNKMALPQLHQTAHVCVIKAVHATHSPLQLNIEAHQGPTKDSLQLLGVREVTDRWESEIAQVPFRIQYKNATWKFGGSNIHSGLSPCWAVTDVSTTKSQNFPGSMLYGYNQRAHQGCCYTGVGWPGYGKNTITIVPTEVSALFDVRIQIDCHIVGPPDSVAATCQRVGHFLHKAGIIVSHVFFNATGQFVNSPCSCNFIYVATHQLEVFLVYPTCYGRITNIKWQLQGVLLATSKVIGQVILWINTDRSYMFPANVGQFVWVILLSFKGFKVWQYLVPCLSFWVELLVTVIDAWVLPRRGYSFLDASPYQIFLLLFWGVLRVISNHIEEGLIDVQATDTCVYVLEAQPNIICRFSHIGHFLFYWQADPLALLEYVLLVYLTPPRVKYLSKNFSAGMFGWDKLGVFLACREGSHSEGSLIIGLKLCRRVLQMMLLCLWWTGLVQYAHSTLQSTSPPYTPLITSLNHLPLLRWSYVDTVQHFQVWFQEFIAHNFTRVGQFHFQWEPGPVTSHWQLDSILRSYNGDNGCSSLLSSVPASVQFSCTSGLLLGSPSFHSYGFAKAIAGVVMFVGGSLGKVIIGAYSSKKSSIGIFGWDTFLIVLAFQIMVQVERSFKYRIVVILDCIFVILAISVMRVIPLPAYNFLHNASLLTVNHPMGYFFIVTLMASNNIFAGPGLTFWRLLLYELGGLHILIAKKELPTTELSHLSIAAWFYEFLDLGIDSSEWSTWIPNYTDWGWQVLSNFPLIMAHFKVLFSAIFRLHDNPGVSSSNIWYQGFHYFTTVHHIYSPRRHILCFDPGIVWTSKVLDKHCFIYGGAVLKIPFSVGTLLQCVRALCKISWAFEVTS